MKKEVGISEKINNVSSSDLELNLRNILYEARIKKGKSFKEVEDYTGVSASYICRIESGQRKMPSAEVVQILSDFYGIDMFSLLPFLGVYINTIDLNKNNINVKVNDKIIPSRKLKKLILNNLNCINISNEKGEE